MSKKTVFVILWLTFSSFLLAQAPADGRTVSASETKTQPCWEQVVKSLAEGASCLAAFNKELGVQKNNPKVLEELKLAGVRFLKANGYSDQGAVAIVAEKIKIYASVEVLRPATPAEVKPTPTASEETREQKENRELREKIAALEKLMARDTLILRRAEVIDAERKLKAAQDKLRKNRDEDSSARQAREEMEKREKAEKEMRQRIIDARSMAKVEGCGDPTFSFNPPENLPDTQMWVDVRAASFPRSKYRMFTGAKYFRQYMQIRIINPVRGPAVDIEWNDRAFKGVVVKNLCPGGRVTLMREREPMVDDNMVTVQIQVIRHDGRTMYPQQYTMSSWDYQRGTFPIYQIPNY